MDLHIDLLPHTRINPVASFMFKPALEAGLYIQLQAALARF